MVSNALRELSILKSFGEIAVKILKLVLFTRLYSRET